MTREILVMVTTDHDDTLQAVQSVIRNLGRAGYVADYSAIYTEEPDPEQEYKFVTRHAAVHVKEIDLYMEQTREEAVNEQEAGSETAVGSHGLGEEAQGVATEGSP